MRTRVELLESALRRERQLRIEAEMALKERLAIDELHGDVPVSVRCWCGERTVFVAASVAAAGGSWPCSLRACQVMHDDAKEKACR